MFLQGYAVIEIQVRPNQDRDQFLALYRVRRASFGYRLCKRYFLLKLKIHFVDRLDTEPVSGSRSLIQILCIEHKLVFLSVFDNRHSIGGSHQFRRSMGWRKMKNATQQTKSSLMTSAEMYLTSVKRP